MGRRRIDWVQFGILLLVLLGMTLRFENRISRVEQHLVDQDRDNAEIRQRLSGIESRLRR